MFDDTLDWIDQLFVGKRLGVTGDENVLELRLKSLLFIELLKNFSQIPS